MVRNINLIIFILSLTSCSLAPFSNSYNGQSNGQSNWNIDLGASANGAIPYLRIGRGFSSNFDFGVVTEVGFGILTGLWLKYSVLNNRRGFSFALDGGGGSGIGGGESKYYYAGPVMSYSGESLELYVLGRYNVVNLDSQDIEIGKNYGDITIPAYQFNYLSGAVGANYWLSEVFGINFNANILSAESGSNSELFYGAGILFKNL